MDDHKHAGARGSVFSGLFHSQEAPVHAAPPAAEHKPAAPAEQTLELHKRLAVLEKTVAEQAEKLAAERLPPPPPPPQRVSELAEARIKRLEERLSGLEAGPGRNDGVAQKKLAALEARLAALEELSARLGGETAGLVSVTLAPLEGRLQSLEAGLANELKDRFGEVDSALRDAVVKARAAQEASAGAAQRMDKMDERLAQLPYLENRVGGIEEKSGRIYDVEAVNHSLELRMEKLERDVHNCLIEVSNSAVEGKRVSSELDSLSRTVSHLSALFNHFRSELAFLMPKIREGKGG